MATNDNDVHSAMVSADMETWQLVQIASLNHYSKPSDGSHATNTGFPE